VRLFSFYNQQLRTAVEARYLDEAERNWRHRVLAAYFASQPWRLGRGHWNWRKVDEQVSQEEWAGQRTAAEQTLERLACELETEPVDLEEIMALSNRLQYHFTEGGQWQIGERLLRQQLAASQAQQDREAEGITLVGLGSMAAAQGHPDEAARYLTSGLAIVKEVGNRASEANALGIYGVLAAVQGRPDEAARYFEQTLTIAQETGELELEAGALTGLAELAAVQARFAESADYFERALGISQKLGYRTFEASSLTGLAQLAAVQGHFVEATRYFEQALAILEAIEDHTKAAVVRQALASLTAQRPRHRWWPFARRGT
jgi:tetratricopeptide (TPR) repeat protein